jgi:hypothetical protein
MKKRGAPGLFNLPSRDDQPIILNGLLTVTR